MIEIHNGRYGVDQNGVIYSLRNHAGNRRPVPKPIRTKMTREGYYTCGVYEDTVEGVIRRTCFVHRLVALAYHSNPFNKPEVNHEDGVKGNNRPSNLQWMTEEENTRHAFMLGLRKGNPSFKGKFNDEHPRSRPIRQLTLTGSVVRVFPSSREAQRNGFSQSNISMVISGQRKSHKGYRWEFAS